MRRLSLTVFPALSLLLCAAVCVLWVRSYWRGDWLMSIIVSGSAYDGTQRNPWVESNLGTIRFCQNMSWFHYVQRSPIEVRVHTTMPLARLATPASALRNSDASLKPPTGWSWGGFGWARMFSNGGGPNASGEWHHIRYDRLILPHWFVATLLLLPGLPLIRRIVQRSRLRPGCCAACGYDLRATPDRCPECGTERENHEGTKTRSGDTQT